MKHISLIFLIFASCAPKTGLISATQVANDTAAVTHAPMPVLHAWRKKPGQPKTVQVQGYHRKDSTYVAAHRRTKKGA